MKYEPFDLNEEQKKEFLIIFNDKYSYGAFTGMCSNQAQELNLVFDEVLKTNLDMRIRAKLTAQAKPEPKMGIQGVKSGKERSFN